MNIGTRYKVAFMSGSYLAKVSHVYIYHKVSLMSVYNIAKMRLLYIYIYRLKCDRTKVRLSDICRSHICRGFTYIHRGSEGGWRSLAPPFSQKVVWKCTREGQFFKIFLNTSTFEISPPPLLKSSDRAWCQVTKNVLLA